MGLALERLKREQHRTRDASEALRRRIDRLGGALGRARRRAAALREEQRKLVGSAATAARGRPEQTWAAATGLAGSVYAGGCLVAGALSASGPKTSPLRRRRSIAYRSNDFHVRAPTSG